MTINELCALFGKKIIAKRDIVTGIINNTFIVTDAENKRYILQEINSNVFKNVDAVMQNIEKVTSYLKEKIENEGGDVQRESLNLVKCDGKSYAVFLEPDGRKRYFRMYDCIENATTFDEASEELLYEAGAGFGKFQRMLSDFPARELYESIPNFHNTKIRFQVFTNSLTEAIKKCDIDYLDKVKSTVNFAMKNKVLSGLIVEALEKGEIPYRVVHNDTKLNNVMLDNDTHKAVCVIDLDTIMPGSILYDYGDAIRYGANSGLEDDVNLQNVELDLGKFTAFTDGFLSETASSLTKKELKLMPYAPIVLGYELGLRFLTDYLDENKYFKCDGSRPDHNLERAKAQFKLTEDMQSKLGEMTKIVNSLYEKHTYSTSKKSNSKEK